MNDTELIAEIDSDRKCMYCVHVRVCKFMELLQAGHFKLPYPRLNPMNVDIVYIALANSCLQYYPIEKCRDNCNVCADESLEPRLKQEETAVEAVCTCGYDSRIGRIADPGCLKHSQWKS